MSEHPKLRALDAVPLTAQGRHLILLRDPEGFAPEGLALPAEVFFIASMLDGTRSVREVQVEIARRTGEMVFTDRIEQIIAELDEHFLLESERFATERAKAAAAFRAAAVRPPTHATESLGDDATAVSAELDRLLEASSVEAPESLLAYVAPHIDLARGGSCYGAAYRAVRAVGPAELYVILGTAHWGPSGTYVLTEKDFQTPVGTLRTDREAVEFLQDHTSADLLADELVHKTEHSVEYQVLWLQHTFGKRDDVAMVPVLCGGFQELIDGGARPSDAAEIQEFIAALRAFISESGKRVCLVASADLAHVGPRFGDRQHTNGAVLAVVRARDRETLRRVEAVDAEGFFADVAENGNDRHICGLPCIYTLLAVTEATQGRVLEYGQAPDPDGQSAVTFASVALW